MKNLILIIIVLFTIPSCQNNKNSNISYDSAETILKSQPECADTRYTQFVSHHINIKSIDHYEHMSKGAYGCIPRHKLNLPLSNLFTSVDISINGVNKKAILFDAIYMHAYSLNEEYSPGCLITTESVVNNWNTKINTSQICPDQNRIAIGICDRLVNSIYINNVLFTLLILPHSYMIWMR